MIVHSDSAIFLIASTEPQLGIFAVHRRVIFVCRSNRLIDNV
jgi:hypothetical protein